MLYEVLSSENHQQWSEEFRDDWSSEKDVCDWHGVTCRDGKVTELAFPNSGLMV